MSASFFDLMKYAATGIASPSMTAYDKMRALAAFDGGETQTLTGVPPLSFKANGKPLISWSMKGNGQQTGTPTPDAPIMPEFVGVRTGNLWGVPIVQGAVSDAGDFLDLNTRVRGEYIPVQPETQYTISCNKSIRTIYAYLNKSKVEAVYGGSAQNTTVTFTTPANCNSVCVGFMNDPATAILTPSDIEFVMLNIGYKIPITCAGQTTPVYLGEVPTVRRVKKLVLTGSEPFYNATISGGIVRFALALDNGAIDGSRNGALCTHYIYRYATDYGAFNISGDGRTIYFRDSTFADIDAWKAYLAQQYAAGTPVTIWYALNTPQTAIVNEPLCKIGDYADELSSADAGATTPTAKGQNTLTVDTELQPSEMSVTGHIKSS